jgi:conjugal transfer pilus assembly protein TraF
MYFPLISFLFLASSLSLWHDRKAEGWAWYEDPAKPHQDAEHKEVISPSEQLAVIRKELDNQLATAILNPTPENVTAYIQAQQKWLLQSELFAKVWSLAVLNNPQLDATIDHPISQYGIAVSKEIAYEKRTELIKQLS